MKVKSNSGEWKRVQFSLTISAEGKSLKEVTEIIKMLEDFMSTTLVTPYSLTITQRETEERTLPFPDNRKTITFARLF